ncbi:non-ribosomal peptide synthetase [Streptomyces sp. MST-110588]|uniref:non-ribosomal peptide synthetase n=1 Tax=Streptomyces sp. MST-110588 TaxID=2833628 RepID=UPI001F5C9906|nr:non-ribosomal peptide synthetase [Streptomyces sp. MST-110588]
MSSSTDAGTPPGRPAIGDGGPDALPAYGRGTPLPRPEPAPVHELVARFARTTPARTAVRAGSSAITYRELDLWAGRIAARLTAAGVCRGDRVGILVRPSTTMVAAVLGTLRAQAAYVPVDLAHPDRRIADVLADARVTVALADETARPRLRGAAVPLVRAEETAEEDDDPGHRAAAAPADGASPAPVGAADPAYLIYTSGSTGEPKGVLVEHGQLTASTHARRLVYPGVPVFLLVSPLAFDSSVAGLWGTLTAGGRLIVASPEEVRDPERLVGLVERHRVTRLLCVPPLYGVLLDAAERLGMERLRTLESVTVAGEPLPRTLMERHFALHPRQVALVNEYGPTEATVWASYRRYDTPGPVSIGGPVPGTRLHVLDENLRPVPPGTEGELFIGGSGVARGYFGRPEATAQAFLDDPYADEDGARMYRTGDRVRWNAEGTLDYLGRLDHQVKIRGHRVELGAVEEELRALEGVRDAVVLPDGSGARLTGFVLAPVGTDTESLRRRLGERLPAAMVPSRIDVLDGFPVTVNGKVDRAGLRRRADLAATAPAVRTDGGPAPANGAPATDRGNITARVAAAWAEVLTTRDIPQDVNFFDLGGHSLTMFQLQDALERHTGSRPSVVSLFRHTTVLAQAALISGEGGTQGAPRDRRQAAARQAQAVRARRRRETQEPAQ